MPHQDLKIGTAIDVAIDALSDSENLYSTIAYQSGYSAGKRSKLSMAQAIRNAAVNWPKYLGDVECAILHSFCGEWAYSGSGYNTMRAYLSGMYGDEGKIKARTFMLLVAEALES
jgi:hypothetical protein